MAKFVMKDAVVTVNAVDLSNWCSSATIEVTTDEVDVTSFGPSGYREFLDGYKDATITCTFFQDFAATRVDATLWPLFTGGGTFQVSVRGSTGTGSPVATNPEYRLPAARMFGYTPIGGAVGDASSTDVAFRNAGTAGLTKHTA